MEPHDPDKRIAELERQVAEQKRIADLERQLAEAKAAAGQYDGAQPPTQTWGPSGPDAAQLRAAQAFGQPAFNPPSFRRRRSMTGAGRFGAIAGLIGGCIGGAVALTAVFPSTALWTSSIVCGAPNQLMINTSHYSYKPGQSGTNVDFQCLHPDGAQAVNFLAIGALQFLVVLVVATGVMALGYLVQRRWRRQPLTPVRTVLAGGLGLVSLVVLVAFIGQAIASSSGPIQMAQGGSLTVKGNGETKTIACNGGHLTVNGRDETVTVTGHCSRVSVDGVIHHVTIDSADAIDVDGIHNVVTYHSGSPNVTNNGLNTVQPG